MNSQKRCKNTTISGRWRRSWPGTLYQNWMSVNGNTFQTTEEQHVSIDWLQCTDVLKHVCPSWGPYILSILYASLCPSYHYFTFFPSSSVCQSVRPSVCISPSWQPAYSPPPPPSDAIYRNWLLSENTSPCFVPSPVLQIFFFLIRDALS